MPELLAGGAFCSVRSAATVWVTPRQGLTRSVHCGPENSLSNAGTIRARRWLIPGRFFPNCEYLIKSSTHYRDSRINASPRRNDR
jgi:hypothetical protein